MVGAAYLSLLECKVLGYVFMFVRIVRYTILLLCFDTSTLRSNCNMSPKILCLTGMSILWVSCEKVDEVFLQFVWCQLKITLVS